MIPANAFNLLKRQGFKRYLSQDTLAWVLIGLSSLLLGIWALKGTIALRNILLGVESVISIYCLFISYRFNYLGLRKNRIKNLLPLLLLASMFLWVIVHSIFFTRYPAVQHSELTSTWFRAILASIVGAGTGRALIVVSKKQIEPTFGLWLGILFSFCYLLFQYLLKAVAHSRIFTIDYSGYIVYGKISGVLIGSVFIAALLGAILDNCFKYRQRMELPILFFLAISLLLPLYVYVFVLDTRNGIALALFSILQAILILVYRSIKAKVIKLDNQSQKNRVGNHKLKIFNVVLVMLGVIIIVAVIYAHTVLNTGWHTIIEDAKIGIQVSEFSNWQNPQVQGYPSTVDGRTVIPNTYERFAWATAGLTIFMPENPLGVGILKEPFRILLLDKYPNGGAYIPSTHSAWIEIGLAYGYPGLILLMGSLLSIFWLSVTESDSKFQYSAMLLSSTLLLLYLVGEISSQHSIEILCFMITMLTFLLFLRSDAKYSVANIEY